METRKQEAVAECGLTKEKHFDVGDLASMPFARPAFPRQRRPSSRRAPKQPRRSNYPERVRAIGRLPSTSQIIVACEMILKSRPQRMGTPSEVEASLGFSTAIGGRQCGSTQRVPIIISEEKNDEAFPEISEVPLNLLQHSENSQATSSRASLPRITWRVLRQVVGWLAVGWNRARHRVRFEQRRKRLRLCESLSLGEKRFVAVIEVDGEQILVGGGASGVATLARLQPSREFAGMMKERWIREPREA